MVLRHTPPLMPMLESPGQRRSIRPQRRRPAPSKCLPRSIETEPMIDQKTPPVEADVSAAILTPAQGTRLCEASSWQARPLLQRRGAAGFTLAELLVSVGVLVVLVLFFGQVLKSTATIT